MFLLLLILVHGPVVQVKTCFTLFLSFHDQNPICFMILYLQQSPYIVECATVSEDGVARGWSVLKYFGVDENL